MSQVNIDFYTSTTEAWESMLRDILAAQTSIDIEQYIFAHDVIGDRFIDALIQKAKQGLSVRILLDMVGSYGMYNSTLADELRQYGIQINFFNPIKPWRIRNFTSNFFRDHRKLLIVDDSIGHIGGVGIEDRMANWRDTHMRVTGAIVNDMTASFEWMWKGFKRWNFLRLKKQPEFIKKFNFLTNAPMIRQRHIYQALLGNIRNARKYIFLTSPYFIPDRKVFRALRLAARRGVDVRLVVPTHTDHTFVDYADQSYFSIALRAKIRIYQFGPNMLHAKSIIIDDTWATAGSFNLDNLSFLYNYESNIASDDEQFIHTLKSHFFEDLKHSSELKYKEWIRRPMQQKFMEFLTWPFHSVM